MKGGRHETVLSHFNGCRGLFSLQIKAAERWLESHIVSQQIYVMRLDSLDLTLLHVTLKYAGVIEGARFINTFKKFGRLSQKYFEKSALDFRALFG